VCVCVCVSMCMCRRLFFSASSGMPANFLYCRWSAYSRAIFSLCAHQRMLAPLHFEANNRIHCPYSSAVSIASGAWQHTFCTRRWLLSLQACTSSLCPSAMRELAPAYRCRCHCFLWHYVTAQCMSYVIIKARAHLLLNLSLRAYSQASLSFSVACVCVRACVDASVYLLSRLDAGIKSMFWLSLRLSWSWLLYIGILFVSYHWHFIFFAPEHQLWGCQSETISCSLFIKSISWQFILYFVSSIYLACLLVTCSAGKSLNR